MQLIGESILSVFSNSLEIQINRKDFIIKNLADKLEKAEKENRELKELMSNLGIFLQGLGG